MVETLFQRNIDNTTRADFDKDPLLISQDIAQCIVEIERNTIEMFIQSGLTKEKFFKKTGIKYIIKLQKQTYDSKRIDTLRERRIFKT